MKIIVTTHNISYLKETEDRTIINRVFAKNLVGRLDQFLDDEEFQLIASDAVIDGKHCVYEVDDGCVLVIGSDHPNVLPKHNVVPITEFLIGGYNEFVLCDEFYA